MPILDEILGFFRKPRPPVVEQDAPPVEPNRIRLKIDLARIHDKRHQGPGCFGYSWEENAAIGIMNALVAAGIPMDWHHFITWVPDTGLRDALSFERMKPTRGTLQTHRHFAEREVICVTWTA